MKFTFKSYVKVLYSILVLAYIHPGRVAANPNIDYEKKYNGGCDRELCSITCKHGSSEMLGSDVDMSMGEYPCKQIKLKIHKYSFAGSKIPESWQAWKRPVTELEISHSPIEKIRPNAFVNPCFSETVILTLHSLNLKSLSYGVFNGLHNVVSLTISQKTPIEKVHKQVLSPFRNKLRNLTIQAQMESVELFRNCDDCMDITSLDLSKNNFGDINSADVFNNFSRLEYLNLSRSHITFLPTGMFDVIGKTLKMLDLSYNKLKYLSATHMKPIIHKDSQVEIDLSRNPYKCDCTLAPLTSVIAKFTKHFVRVHKIICDEPEAFKGEYLVFKLFLTCDSTATKNFTDVAMNSLVPDKLHKDVTKLMCHFKQCEGKKCKTNARFPINLRRVQGTLELTVQDDGSVEVHVSNVDGEFGILWFKKTTKKYYQMDINHKEFGLGCTIDVDGPIIIDNFEQDVPYLVCLVKKDDLYISPWSCSSFRSGDSYSKSSYWLTQSAKSIVIASSIGGAALALVLGAYIFFFIVKRRPTILKRSKRVVVAKKDSKDILVLPRNRKSRDRPYETLDPRRRLPDHRMNNNYAYPNIYEALYAADNRRSFDEVSIYYSSNIYSGLSRPPKRFSNDPLPMLPSTEKDENFYSDSCISESRA